MALINQNLLMNPVITYLAQRKCLHQLDPDSILEGDDMDINTVHSSYALLKLKTILLKNVSVKDGFWSGPQSSALSGAGCFFLSTHAAWER